MAPIKSILLFVVAAAAAANGLVTVTPGDGTEKIANDYIVMFHPDSAEADRLTHMATLKAALAESDDLQREWSFGNFHAYQGIFSNNVLDFIRTEEHVVVSIEHNIEMSIDSPLPMQEEVKKVQQPDPSCSIQRETTWGLVRTAERVLRIDGNYNHDISAGQKVDAYVLDTGIYTEHVDFAGRAVTGKEFVQDGYPGSDGNGHGTHVAGTIGANKWGVARATRLIAVKVLSATGSGSTAGVIDGVQYVADEHRKNKNTNACVANMSLGGGLSSAMNAAVTAATTEGCIFVLAAGNEYGSDACGRSPAGTGGTRGDAITVGSTTNTDRLSAFSNVGTCVDILAPGSAIESTWINDPTSVNTISGTSMACPHVAGAAAKLLSGNPGDITPKGMKELLSRSATDDLIEGLPSNNLTPNKLLFADCS